METIEQPTGTLHPLLQRRLLPIKTMVAAREVALDAIAEGDLLLIQTANSIYSFSLTDAKERCGLLMGGHLGEVGVPALLVGARGDEGADAEHCRARLVAGVPAVFMVASNDNSTRLVTSAIKSLTHIQAIYSKSRTLHDDRSRP